MTSNPKTSGAGAPLFKQRRAQHRRAWITSTMSCAASFRITAHGCLQDIVANQAAACEENREALHRMRIALMRLRTLVSFFSPMVLDPEWVRLKRELKWLNGYLGAARDMDVLMIRLKAGPDRRFHTSSETNARNRKWIDSHRRATRVLRSNRYRRLIRDLSRWIKNGGRAPDGTALTSRHRLTPIATYSARRLTRWHKKLLRKSRRLESMSARKRHRLRIQTKKLRYAIEFFGDLFSPQHPARQKAVLKHLRRAQESLGSLNDAEIACSLATSFRGLSHDTADQDRERTEMSNGGKRTRKLMHTAAAAYRELAQAKPFWA